MRFADALEGLLDAPGALGAAFIDPQGEIIARVGGKSATEVLGAYQSVWLGELRRAAERSGLGEISDLSFQFASRRILTTHVKADRIPIPPEQPICIIPTHVLRRGSPYDRRAPKTRPRKVAWGPK